MRKAAIVVDSFYSNNRLFDLSDTIANRDNCLLPFARLREECKNKGIDLATSDVHPEESSEIVIYNDIPLVLPKPVDGQCRYLLLFESELIRPDNWELSHHNKFDKIFTWHDDYIDNDTYFKINFSHELPKFISKRVQKEKLCCIIGGNKKVQHPLELYSKRTEVIRWFEKCHFEDFDLYGMGWDECQYFGGKVKGMLKRIKPLSQMLAASYPSYKGRVESKKDTLEQYKFSICFENAKDIPGYITEKIFDCFFAGCVPVYWGANNVSKHIPKDCFIDMRKFSGYKDMYQYMKNMSDEEYLDYLNAIERFILSDKSYQFSTEYFAKTITEQMLAS